MGVGSLIGAVVGGMLVGLIPASALKIALGVILNISAVQMFHGTHAARESDVNRAERKG
jgi:uncharacterized membrane protein YfcA